MQAHIKFSYNWTKIVKYYDIIINFNFNELNLGRIANYQCFSTLRGKKTSSFEIFLKSCFIYVIISYISCIKTLIKKNSGTIQQSCGGSWCFTIQAFLIFHYIKNY